MLGLLLTLIPRALRRKARKMSRRAPRRRLGLEPLEDRTVPSTVLWTNRGSPTLDSDGFNAVFGSQAELARSVADAAVQAWQNVIANFNYSDGSNTFRLDISAAAGEKGVGGWAYYPSEYDASFKPKRGRIQFETGTDGKGAGYFLDPTPRDSSEFRGTVVNAFAGDATAGSAAVGKIDFFTVLAHEMTHALGLTADSRSAFQRDAHGYIARTGKTDAYFGIGQLFTFTGPSVQGLFSSYNRGGGGADLGYPFHSAEPINTYTSPSGVVYYGSQDTNNAVYEYGRRYLPSQLDVLLLQDAYGYAINPPQTFGTFYASLNPTTGDLLVRGGATGVSNDAITLWRSGSEWVVSAAVGNPVPGTGPTGPLISVFPAAQVKSIAIQSGNGNDTILVEDTLAGVPLTLDGGDGNDTISVGSPLQGLDSILGPVTVTGGNGADTLIVNDRADAANGAAYTVRTNAVFRNNAGTITYGNSVENVVLNGGSGTNTITVESTSGITPVAVNAGAGDDTIRIGNAANKLDDLRGPLTINGEAGRDALVLLDQGNTLGLTYTVNATTIRRYAAAMTTYNGVETIAIFAGTGNDALLVDALADGTSFHLDGGPGVDTLRASNQPNTWRLIGLNGGTLNGKNTFTTVENLIGGSDADTFVITEGAGVTSSIDGGAGSDTLDYSAFQTAVTFDLIKGKATGTTGGPRNIENAIGGAGNDTLTGDNSTNILRGGGGNDTLSGMGGDDILMGDSGNDRLDAGLGNDVLIGGSGADTLLGGSGNDLLIGSATLFDSSDALLRALLAEWARTDQTYDQRLEHLRNATGLNVSNGTPVRLNPTTILDDGAADVLTGGTEQDWFWANVTGPVKDAITDALANERIN